MLPGDKTFGAGYVTLSLPRKSLQPLRDWCLALLYLSKMIKNELFWALKRVRSYYEPAAIATNDGSGRMGKMCRRFEIF